MPKIYWFDLVPSHNRMGLEKNLEFQRVFHYLPGPSHQFDLKAPFTRQKIFGTAGMKVVRVSKKLYSLLIYKFFFLPR